MVFSKNETNQDIILTGLGLGFQKKRGDAVDPAKIERIFTLDEKSISSKLSALLKQIPIQYFYIADKIKHLAETKLKKKLSPNIYVTLCDHIYYAVERFHQGLLFQNQLMWEIRRFYPNEYKTALKSIKIINHELDIDFPESEACFIALHIINAEIGGEEIQSVVEMTRLIKEICNIVQYHFGITFNEDSLSYTRFILHLKFFSQRLLIEKQSIDEADFLYTQMQETMNHAFCCAKKIASFIKKSYQYDISKSEIVYLTIHIQRLLAENFK